MHRFFTFEDLIHELCSYLSPVDLSILACVSSIWFRHAISRLYKEVSIENALAPMGELARQYDDSDLFCFIKSPGVQQLERFSKYAPYVQILHIHQDHYLALSEAILKSRLNGVQYLFPNTRSLSWTVTTNSEFQNLADSLISPNVDRLHLVTHDYQPAFLEHINLLLRTRLSELRSLRIDDMSSDTKASASQSVALMRPMQKILGFFATTLKSVHIPLIYDTGCMVEYLAKIPSLCNLTIGEVLHDNDNTLKTNSNAIYGRQGGFTSLGTFSFDGPPQSLHERFLKPFDLSSLTTFSWHFNVTPADVHVFITTIVTTCPRLKNLTLGAPKIMRYAVERRVAEWASIRPIIRCKELTSLSFNCFEVSVTVEELTEFLRSKTTWRRLDLFTSEALAVQNLFLYAKYCPDLTHLGVYLHASPVISSLTSLLSHHSVQFKVLTSIDFGQSDLGSYYSVHKVGRFLYKICEKPLDLDGFDAFYYHQISRVVASCHLDEETRTGQPLPLGIKERAEKISRDIWPAQYGFRYDSDSSAHEDEERW